MHIECIQAHTTRIKMVFWIHGPNNYPMRNPLLAFVLVSMLSAQESSTACSCMGGGSVKSSYQAADWVISGTVVSIDTLWLPDSLDIRIDGKLGVPVDSLDKRYYGFYVNKVLIKVDALYKG